MKIGDTVKWSNGRKPLGVIIHMFRHKGLEFAVLEKPTEAGCRANLIVVRVYEKLVKVL